MTKRSVLILGIIHFLIAGMSNLSAQNPFIQNYTSFDGLPSNNVYQVYQDSRKFIWFATDAGVAMFDGSRFNYFSKKDGLSCNDVVHIKEDSQGRVWFFNMDASLNFYRNGLIHNETTDPYLDSLISLEFFRDFYEDSDHTIYFYHNHQREIFALDTSNKVVKYYLPGLEVRSYWKSSPVEGMDVRYMARVNGWFYLWTIAGQVKMQDFTQDPVVSVGPPHYKAVFPDDKNLLIVTNGKNGDKYSIVKTTGYFSQDSLFEPIAINSDFISSVIEDKNGFVWVSTYDEGVYCYQGNNSIRHFDIKQAQAIIEDHERNIWISSLKDGVFKISPNLTQHRHFERKNFNGLGVLGLARHIEGGVWMTNGSQVYLLQNDEFLTMEFKQLKSNLNQLMQVDEQNLIVGEFSTNYYSVKGIRLDHSMNKITFDKIKISPRPYKTISLNQAGNEVLTWDFFTVILINPWVFEVIKDIRLGERVYNTFYNSDGEIVINAKRNFIFKNDTLVPCVKLSIFNERIITDHMVIEDSVDVFNVEDDSIFILTNNRLYNLSAQWDYPPGYTIKFMEYHSPTLYIATPGKIYYCNDPLNVVDDDPVALEVMDITFRNIQDILFSEGQLYVASDDGLTAISVDLNRNADVFPPIPYFESVQINDLPQTNSNLKMELTGRNKILMGFGCINYSFNPAIYSYKLEGLDEDWQQGSGDNVVYESLPKGEYIFKLRARKPDSDWSNTIEYRIRIKATLLQQPLFYAILLLVVAGVGIILVIWRKNVEIKRREIEHQLVLLEQRALQAMMNPHFIFNSLGSVQNYLLQSKPAEASLYLSQFARLIRQNLNSSTAAMISLEEEVDRLKNYLDLEKKRMEKKFEYKIDIDEAINPEAILIPSMIIQPFVENSVWHGIPKMAEKGMIEISFILKDKKSIKIIVEDNGSGMKKGEIASVKSGKHLAMGMAMTRKRLELLGKKYNLATGIEITEVNPGDQMPGTHVEIVVPFASAAEHKEDNTSDQTG